MVDRGHFDEWLRKRAADSGADRQYGTFKDVGVSDGDSVPLTFQQGRKGEAGEEVTVRTRYVIGADGAHSKVGRGRIPGSDNLKCVFAYHEIVEAPGASNPAVDGKRCDVLYEGALESGHALDGR